MTPEELKSLIRTVPDFPEPGIQFRDITTLIGNGEGFAATVEWLADRVSASGAQAIAAMAYGTESVPRCAKVFGPGNSWVTEAKQQVSLDPQGAAIDMPAGPSEVLVIADGGANAGVPPKPGRSTAITRQVSARRGTMKRQSSWLAPKPCTSTTTGPCP